MQTTPSLRVIELFGPPGAGKSTLARIAAEGSGVLTRADLGRSWRGQSLARKAVFVGWAYLQPRMIGCAVRIAWGAPLLNPEALLRLARLLVKAQWIRAQKGTILLDQGPLQELWSIFYASGVAAPDPRLVAPLLNCLYGGGTKIMFIDVDPSIASARIRGRSHGHSRLDRIAPSELEASLERTEQLPRCIVDAATKAGLEVHIMRGSEPLDALAFQLAAQLEPEAPPNGK